jgi:DNA polymerase elongation subunit (family B)
MTLSYKEDKMKILLLDIENSPNLGHVWGLWQQNISLAQLQESAYVLCWAAKWLGEDYVYFDSLNQSSRRSMMKSIHKMLNEADAVIHYNGSKHDIPLLNKEFLELGMKPPSPYKQIDLYRTVKSVFKFPSNKLEYVCKALGVGQKIKTIGHELWTRCMTGKDQEAWDMMEEYNVNDVDILEQVYNKLLPWIPAHANHSLYSDDSLVCPNCGGHHLQKRGFYYTLASKFQRFQCKDCGKWSRDNKIVNSQQYKTVGIN